MHRFCRMQFRLPGKLSVGVVISAVLFGNCGGTPQYSPEQQELAVDSVEGVWATSDGATTITICEDPERAVDRSSGRENCVQRRGATQATECPNTDRCIGYGGEPTFVSVSLDLQGATEAGFNQRWSGDVSFTDKLEDEPGGPVATSRYFRGDDVISETEAREVGGRFAANTNELHVRMNLARLGSTAGYMLVSELDLSRVSDAVCPHASPFGADAGVHADASTD